MGRSGCGRSSLTANNVGGGLIWLPVSSRQAGSPRNAVFASILGNPVP
jgi:hypothetical protein